MGWLSWWFKDDRDSIGFEERRMSVLREQSKRPNPGEAVALSMTSCADVQRYYPEYTLEEHNKQRVKHNLGKVDSIHGKGFAYNFTKEQQEWIDKTLKQLGYGE